RRWRADAGFGERGDLVAARVRGPRAVRGDVVPRHGARPLPGAPRELDGRHARVLRRRVPPSRGGDGVPRRVPARRAARRRDEPAAPPLLTGERWVPGGDVAPAQRPRQRRRLPRPPRGAHAVSAYGYVKPAEGSWTEHYPELGTA